SQYELGRKLYDLCFRRRRRDQLNRERSFSTAEQSGTGRVEDGRGSLGPIANAPFPIPAHRTGRAALPHPALRLASPRGTRRCLQWQAFEAQEATFSLDDVTGQPACPAPSHPMPSADEDAPALPDRTAAPTHVTR